METATRSPRGGIKLNRAQLEYQLARRGARWIDLARESRLTTTTLSLARHGRPVTPDSFEKITAALLRMPVMPGADLLLTEPEKENAAATNPAASSRAVGQGNGRTAMPNGTLSNDRSTD